MALIYKLVPKRGRRVVLSYILPNRIIFSWHRLFLAPFVDLFLSLIKVVLNTVPVDLSVKVFFINLHLQ